MTNFGSQVLAQSATGQDYQKVLGSFENSFKPTRPRGTGPKNQRPKLSPGPGHKSSIWFNCSFAIFSNKTSVKINILEINSAGFE
jgi:hypothetical protein